MKENPNSGVTEIECDTFVYGSTPGGIAAAVEAASATFMVVSATCFIA